MKKEVVVATCGGFDPVHVGHLRLFKEAKKLGDKLIVILNNDVWLVKKKGYAFMSQEERREIIESFECVDQVILTAHGELEFDEDMSVNHVLRQVKPDILAKGGDRNINNIPEKSVCDDLGIKIVSNVGGDKVQSSSDLVKAAASKVKGVMMYDKLGRCVHCLEEDCLC